MTSAARYLANFVAQSNNILDASIALADLGPEVLANIIVAGSELANITTSNIAEGNNLYFTNDRVVTALTAGENITIDANGLITGEPGYVDENAYANSQIWFANITTANVAEGVNLYYTDDRAYANAILIGYASNLYVDERLAAKANVADLTTSNVAEGSNLYYTDERARAAISVTGTGSYDQANGVINIVGGVESVNGETGNVVLDTSNIAEGSNLYFTNARVFANVIAGGFATESYVDSGIANLVNSAPEALDTLYELANALGNDANFATSISTLIGKSYDQANAAYDEANSKTVAADLTTANVAEVTNLYYTNDRVYANVTELGYASNLYVDDRLATKANVTDLTTANVAEDTNLYFTNDRAISAFTAGDNITIDANGLITGEPGYVDENAYANSQIWFANVTTSDVAEGSNLYFTNARVYANVAEIGYAANSYVDDRLSTKANVADLTTSNVAEGANLYFSNDRAIGALTSSDDIIINSNGLLSSNVGAFKTILVNGMANVVAEPNDRIEFVAGAGMTIITNPNVSPKIIAFSANVSGVSGAAGGNLDFGSIVQPVGFTLDLGSII